MADAVHTAERLKELQALPLDRKIQISQARIIEWYQRNHGNVVVSFSGGKDSTVLLHLVRSIYPDVPAVFSNTGLEYPEIFRFVQTFPNVEIVRPKMVFSEVISTYGYPLIGKEVAEAIYYARRIRSQSVQVERERERDAQRESYSDESCVKPPYCADGCDAARHTHTHNGAQTNRTVRKQTADGTTSTDAGRQRDFKRTELGGQNLQWETLVKRTELHWRHIGRAGVKQTGQTGEGGVFSNPTKQFGDLSMFNKEKYLPLARDVPVPISHLCCSKMKKSPMQIYQRANKVVPFLGTLAEESRIRQQAWIRNGCNAFDSKKPQSTPIAFWTEQDILQYIVEYGLQIAPVYGDIVSVDKDGNEYPASCSLCGGCKLKCSGADRTGCVYCGFGFHSEKGETRFQRLSRTHPKLYDYCMNGGQWVDNPAYDPTAPEYDGDWKNWNPKQIWVPSKAGLGMKAVFDMVNEIYGKDFYRYE